MRKAQGLPITTIIVAALGILVLVVIGAIFGGQVGKFGRAASECPGRCLLMNPPADASPNLYYQEDQCNAFETQISGSHLPKGMPSNVDNPGEWMCGKCCIVTG